jgi:SAM-dependent methyltransferase
LYPLAADIADFRLYPDPYISMEADRNKGLRLAEASQSRSFSELLDFYYEITPEVPPDLAARYKAHALAGVRRARGMLERLKAYGLSASGGPGRRVLDLGCGAGAFLAVAAETGAKPVGVDIAFRWLVIAKKQLEELGNPDARLICACADALPFADGEFDLVTAENLLEHTQFPGKVLKEAQRVRRPGGGFVARTVNRYALAPEPHVGLWGVGLLPPNLAESYVRWGKGTPFAVRSLSCRDARRLIHSGGFHDLEIKHPYLSAADYCHHSPFKRWLFSAYVSAGRSVTFLRPLLRFFGPYIDMANCVPTSTVRLHAV